MFLQGVSTTTSTQTSYNSFMITGASLTAKALGPVSRGHPWVFRDGLKAPLSAPVGEPVRLLDHKGRTAAWGLSDEGPIAVRVLGRHPESISALLRRRVARAVALRARVVPLHTDCYRLINAAGDGLPGIVVDRYADIVVLRLYSSAWEPHLDLLVRELAALDIRTVYRRYGVNRVDGRTGGEALHGPTPPDAVVVRENGLKMLARLAVGQKTGLFLDQRAARARAGRLAAGARVVNLFAYNGGFSLYAAAGGATRVLSVDVSAGALEDARENFRLNDLDPDRHGFEVTDVFEWSPTGEAPDVLICDPPGLTRGRKADAAARKAYRELAEQTGRQVASGGVLFTFSCTARLSRGEWEKAVAEGLTKAGRWSVLEQGGAPADHPVAMAHPEGRYLKSLLLARL